MKPNKTLDCTGLFCPMPIINAKTEIEKINSGDIIEIIADDPGFEKDLPAWCKVTGHQFLEIKKEGAVLKGYVKKK
ncbi:MAG: sulfurtransferase TusA family protein [Endomicrobiales bacterium]|nr:sulfurtransferase TusA family protein [Endomicrobiales bacterium]